mmetsp:Transcript_36710/g.60472  ORF Transcript_36710/g.60472 Transcript_36710/m.60472 type:complete len:210 (+) Transcript_36710:179-808(+)
MVVPAGGGEKALFLPGTGGFLVTLAAVFFWAICFPGVGAESQQCYVGYGQRNKHLDDNTLWTRMCPGTDHCVELTAASAGVAAAVAGDSAYAWDAEMEQFYVRACGGAFGLPSDFKDCEEGEAKTLSGDYTASGEDQVMTLRFCCRDADGVKDNEDPCCTAEEAADIDGSETFLYDTCGASGRRPCPTALAAAAAAVLLLLRDGRRRTL